MAQGIYCINLSAPAKLRALSASALGRDAVCVLECCIKMGIKPLQICFDLGGLHDIIGHGMVGAVGPDISRQILDAGIPDFVPEDFDIAKSGTDRSPDVLAAIFANRFGPEDFNEDNDPTGERREVMQKAKEKIDAWKARFPKGKPEMINVEFVY